MSVRQLTYSAANLATAQLKQSAQANSKAVQSDLLKHYGERADAKVEAAARRDSVAYQVAISDLARSVRA
ncbi:hypothetical protein [Magnetofaba australis]|uniref:hypothetical protein n=1 Tax=Magnetofaba australis TaxID=1472297 RepID=UPI000A19FB01|nr:hypothetical protein [Magnetofaba australis]